MSPQDGWVLSIDFGTSNTAAAYLVDGRVRPIPLESGSTTMPSAVVLTDSGYRVGRPAENARRARPDAFEGAPKRLLGKEQVPLGDREVLPEELVAEVLKVVRARAISRAGGTPPSRLILTLPAQWGASKRRALVSAAERAGFPAGQIVLFREPIAALHAYVEPSQLQPGDRVAVVDFGGGTCDVAVLERTADPAPGRDLVVVAADGDERLGGEDLDDRLHTWVLAQLRANGDGELVDLLQTPDHLGEALTLRTVVRSAKQDLSEHPDTEVAVSVAGQERVLRVSREEYEGLIAPDMARMADLTRRVLETSGTQRLTRLFLTGGTAHTPAVARALHEVTGILAEPLGDPKLAVAEGALRSPVLHDAGATLPPPPGAPPAHQPPVPTSQVPPPPPQVGPVGPGVPAGPRASLPKVPPQSPPQGPPQGPPAPPPYVPAGVPVGAGAGGPGGPVGPGGPGGGGPFVHGQSGGRPPAKPWYARGSVIAAIVIGVLVLGGGTIAAMAAMVAGNGTTTGDGGSTTGDGDGDGDGGGTDGGTTPSPSVTPTADPPPTIDCWDGSTTTSTCPPLAGEAAAFWLFDPHVVTEATCSPGDLSAVIGAVEEIYVCQWPDFDGNLLLLRYASVADATAAWTDYGYEASQWFFTDVAEPGGNRFTGEFTREDATWADEVRCLDSVPWCFEAEARDFASADAALQRVTVQHPTVVAEVLATL